MTRLSTLTPLSPAMQRLIDALAQQAAQEHLTAEAASRQPSEAERTNPAPLPGYDRAA